MKRSTFFLIAAILGALFGVLMFFLPTKAAEGFGVGAVPETITMFRALGAFILALGLMNFLVRNHEDTVTLKAVLLTNIVSHALDMVAGLWGVADGVLTITKITPGILTHLFIGIGSFIYLMRIKTPN